MTDAIWAFGSVLKLGDGATPEVFTSIAELNTITPPAIEREAIEVTHHGSTEGWKEFIPGLKDGGEVAFEGNWLPTNATHDETTGILSTLADNSLHNFQIVLPSSVKTLSFAAFVTAFNPDLPVGDKAGLSVTLKVSGKVTVA